MRLFVLVLFAVSSSVFHAFGQAPRVGAEDLRRLTGARWTGTLAYLDYGSNKKVSIRCNLTVTESPGERPSWVFEYEYPDEPKANSKDTVTLGDGGMTFDGERGVERTRLDDGTLRLVTQRSGKDNDRDALIRHTYLIGESGFSIKKEVRPEGAADFFERNRYSWKR